MNCYFCSSELDIGLTCGVCKEFTNILSLHYLNNKNELYWITMISIPNSKNITVELSINENKTGILSHGKQLIILPGFPINPDNFKSKISLYLALR